MSHLRRSWGPLKTPFGRFGPSKGASGAILCSGRLQVADFPWAIRGGAGSYGQTPVGGIRGGKTVIIVIT